MSANHDLNDSGRSDGRTVKAPRRREPVDDVGTLMAELAARYPDPTSRGQLARAAAAAGVGAPPGSETAELVDEVAPIGRAELGVLLTVEGADPEVWISKRRRGLDYHRRVPNEATSCKRSTLHGEIVRRSEAVEQLGSMPCPRCYPSGDDTVPLVAGRYPLVRVGQQYGEPVLGEVRKMRPGGRIVQVVYLPSRTAAWVKADRIVEPATDQSAQETGPGATPGDG